MIIHDKRILCFDQSHHHPSSRSRSTKTTMKSYITTLYLSLFKITEIKSHRYPYYNLNLIHSISEVEIPCIISKMSLYVKTTEMTKISSDRVQYASISDTPLEETQKQNTIYSLFKKQVICYVLID